VYLAGSMKQVSANSDRADANPPAADRGPSPKS
jgi:hypothetical protein